MAAEIEKIGNEAKKAVKRVASDGPLSKPAGMAVAGAALAAIPYAVEKLGGIARPKISEKANEIGDKATSKLKDTASDAMPDSPGEMLGKPLKGMFGGGGDSDGDDDGEGGRAAPGYGSGRRMPVQQAIDVAVPVKRAYNYWTSFEDWPEFMHRIESAEEVDDTTVSFQAKIWGISKRFEADVVEQRPEERIEWNVTDGYAHTGVVTFHPIAKNLTRIDVSLDVQPANLIDKASRGMRFVKRAVRGDLHRFKAYVELEDETKEGRRQTIEDGKVKRKKPSSSKSSRSGSRRSSNGSGPSNGSRAKARSKS
jgi:uncharacterized membrane protein